MKIVIFGCQQVAVDVIRYIKKENKYELPLIVTYELPLDETYGYESVSNLCREHDIRCISTTESPITLFADIKKIEPNLILSIYYRRYIPKKIYELSSHGSFNIHPSKLPYYRGPVPTMWAIQNGETEFGVTLHEIDEGIDTGDIIFQEVYPIEPTETGYDLYLKAMNLSSKMLINNLDKIISKNYSKKTQVGYGSYYGKYYGKAFINWAARAEDIVNFIRARAKPFNPAQTTIYNSYICINRAQVYNSKELTAVVPGTIIKILDNCKVLVACSDGCIILEDYDIFPPLTDVTKKIYLKEGVRLK